MKKYLVLCLLITLSMIIVPIAVSATVRSDAPGTVQNNTETSKSNSVCMSFDTIEVFNHEENRTETLSFRDYIIGVVAAEMPVEFHEEALSAGAVAAATLARKNIMQGADPSLKGAVISTDSTKHQAYMSVPEMQQLWGEDFDKYYKKLCDAVDKSIEY